MLHILLLLLIGLFIGVVGAAPAMARWRGEMEWTYLDYAADQGGGTVVDASHFTQRYGLHWDTRGLLAGGRAGNYKVGLGYQWLALSSELNGESKSVDDGKLTYNGDFLFAPGGLPFRINGFSYDLGVNSIDKADIRIGDGSLLESYGILEPQLAGGIIGGTRMVTGLTLIAGIKNGSYLGTYRELLSKYPRLLVDFHQDYVRDLDAISPQHYQLRDLAFVSLNKKNNWFHYRFQDYTDYLNSTENSHWRQFLVGTVDHLMRREWINLTNWITISTDLSLTLEKEGQEEEESIYAFNLFDVMRRRSFSASNFNTFERTVQGSARGTEYEIPFFVQGDIDANRQYKAVFINYGDEEFSPSGDEEEKGGYLKGQLLLGRMEQIQHVPTLALEVKRGTRGEGEAAEFEYEVFSNPVRYLSSPAWLGRYRAAWVSGETSTGESSNTIEQGVSGEVAWRQLGGWDVTVAQEFLYATDKAPADATRYISLKSNYGSLSGGAERDGGAYFKSVSDVEGNRQLSPNFRNRLKLTYEYERVASEKPLSLLTFKHRFDYQRMITRIASETSLMVGDIISYRTTTDPLFSNTRAVGGQADLSFLHRTSVEYAPSPSLLMKGLAALEWSRGDNLDLQRVGVGEEIRYLFFPKFGFKRKMAEVSQHFAYAVTSTQDGNFRDLKFSLAANWYPLRMLRFGAIAAYASMEPEGNDALEWKVLAGVDFAKLQCELSYAYGLNRNDEEASDGDVKEHLVEARIKKIF